MHYVMPLKCWDKKEWVIWGHPTCYQLFANPVSFHTFYHNIINVVPYMFNSFRIQRNITKT